MELDHRLDVVQATNGGQVENCLTVKTKLYGVTKQFYSFTLNVCCTNILRTPCILHSHEDE